MYSTKMLKIDLIENTPRFKEPFDQCFSKIIDYCDLRTLLKIPFLSKDIKSDEDKQISLSSCLEALVKKGLNTDDRQLLWSVKASTRQRGP